MILRKKGAKNGKYGSAMESLFSKPKYHQRSIVKTVNIHYKKNFWR
jgi:hypothetical protein